MNSVALVSDFATLLLLSGIWMASAQQRQCPKLQKPWNGVILGSCDRYVGAECQFECREPYQLVGSRVRQCQADGTWSGHTAACELDICSNCGCNNCEGDSTCPRLGAPVNGYTEGQCSPGVVSQYCIFRCNSGYAIDGPTKITCLPNNRWSGPAPLCRKKSGALCQGFDIPNGDAVCEVQGSLTVCSIHCNPGFMLVGSSVITCSSSGSWSDHTPACRRSTPDVTNVCPQLVAPEGGRLVGSCSAANTGDTCQLVCISGYRPTDTRVLICQMDGRWSNALPKCISTGCPSIQVPGGTTSGACNPGVPGQSCTITCQSGYVLTGTGTLLCQTNGQWSGATPTCTVPISCPALPAPANGGRSGTCDPGAPGQVCHFQCNSNYQLVGQANLICGSNGQWNGNAPQCTAVRCPPLAIPVNGQYVGSCTTQATVGESCIITCRQGFTLIGQSMLVCQQGGAWSVPTPTCAANPVCPDLNPPANGANSGACRQATVGQSCLFSCQAGYNLVGQSVLFCQAGNQWSSAAPTCARREIEEKTCPKLDPPPHGAFEECNNHVGSRCVVLCEAGFLRTGSRVRTCLMGGTWSGYSPTCTKKVGYTTTYTYKIVPLWTLVFG